VIATCTHGYPSPAACIDCMADGPVVPPPPPRPPSPTVASRLTARFSQRCGGCDDPIHAGDEIARMTDNTYRHDNDYCTEET
jgi:hypothetical protein